MSDLIPTAFRLAQLDPAGRKAADKGLQEARATDLPGPATAAPPQPSASSAPAADSMGFKEVQERLKQTPDFDRAKVDAIKQALQNSQYPLNPRRIAECFVALEQLISD